ncbi:MAG: adenylate/guanylate cyclase domain-containing protein [Pseudomonadota bacterium]
MSKPDSSSELLKLRERQGVRALTIVRGLFAITFVLVVWVIGRTQFEKIATTIVAVTVLATIGLSMLLLARQRAVSPVGLAGCTIDILFLSALPVIWYQSVGGSEVAAAYMVKTQILAVTLAVIAMNALAFRPVYPILVCAAGIVLQGVLLALALADPRTVVSDNFMMTTMGPGLSIELAIAGMILTAITGGMMGYLTLIARRMVTRGVRLEVANSRLGRYFSPGVVSRIAAEPESSLGLGGRAQEVAVMFCDMRNFTTMTEGMAPVDVVALLSQYHDSMVREIFAFGGTIDKFIGDAIMVTFGTPDTREDDAERAVRAALAMNAALKRLNAGRRGLGQSPIAHGIGIHTGPVIAGNIGTDERLEYTVIGDTVNVASRIQEACKPLGETLLISGAVRRRLGPGIQVRSLAEHQVRGRTSAVRLFAVDDQSLAQ